MTDTTHDASALTDDGFHEIQLSGKQLVFLFMLATVVLVATFLLGVQVGRGVRGDRGVDAATAAALSAAAPPTPASTSSQPAASSGPPAAEPPSPAQEPDDELSYAKRLQGDTAPAEKLKTPAHSEPAAPPKTEAAPPRQSTAPPKQTIAAAKPTPATPTEGAAPPAPAPSTPKQDAATPKPATPAAGNGQPGAWVVQLQALKNRAEAADMAVRLAAKGYPAFVLDPVPGDPVYYRVQVGGYPDRSSADRIARQLEKDEHYKPYVRRR